VLKVERNFKVHLAVAAFVILASIFFDIPLTEFLILVLTVTAVLIAELMNTVIEMVMDTFVHEYRVQVKRIKDISAAVVLVTAVASIMIGYLILARHFPPGLKFAFDNLRNSPWYITFVALFIITVLSVFLKFVLKRDSLLSGGMPSIHSGIAFGIWAIISFLTFKDQPIISFLVLFLACLVAQSRVIRKIHRLEEVVIGAITGILVTVIIFQIFWR
jgi:diacylglycerol kinase (ATP)